MARSSSGLGRRPLKAEITSSNLVRATKNITSRVSGSFFIVARQPCRKAIVLSLRSARPVREGMGWVAEAGFRAIFIFAVPLTQLCVRERRDFLQEGLAVALQLRVAHALDV